MKRPRRSPARIATSVWQVQMQAAMMLAEVQVVILYRTLGMAGLRKAAPGEDARMVAEKPRAFAAAATAGARALLAGRDADEVMAAALRPIRRKTRANARRLSRQT